MILLGSTVNFETTNNVCALRFRFIEYWHITAFAHHDTRIYSRFLGVRSKADNMDRVTRMSSRRACTTPVSYVRAVRGWSVLISVTYNRCATICTQKKGEGAVACPQKFLNMLKILRVTCGNFPVASVQLRALTSSSMLFLLRYTYERGGTEMSAERPLKLTVNDQLLPRVRLIPELE